LAAPSLVSVLLNSTTLTVTGSFAAPTANLSYVLDVYANVSGDAEGRVFLDSLSITPNNKGTQSFTFTTTTPATGTYPLITATLTDASGNTSSFSNGVMVGTVPPSSPPPSSPPPSSPPPPTSSVPAWLALFEELLSAFLQGFSYFALNAYQTAQQMQQAQAATQTALDQFHSDVASYTSGKGVTNTQITQDMVSLQQDANNIQELNSTFQTDSELFVFGLVSTGNMSSDDSGQLLVGAYLLIQGQSLANSALQTAAEASSAASASSVPSAAPSGQQVTTVTTGPFNVNGSGLNLQTSQFQFTIAGNQVPDLVGFIHTQVALLKQNINQWLAQLHQLIG